jgi:hypothetical protein
MPPDREMVRLTIYNSHFPTRLAPSDLLYFKPSQFVRLAAAMKAYADTLSVTVVSKDEKQSKSVPN